MKKILLSLTLLSSLAFSDNLDSFFKTEEKDFTDVLLKNQAQLEKDYARKVESIKKNYPREVIYEDDDRVPTVYFKQPKIFTVYTRQELRSWDDIDVVIGAGWKTIVVGKHQMILNDEIKIK